MTRYAFDCETDGLLDSLTVVHSLVLTDVDTGETFSCHDHYGADYDVQTGLRMLMEADQIIGHNIIGYDIPALTKVYPWFKVDEDKVFDTLVASRLIWSDLMDRDAKAIARGILVPKMRGRHSLEAWGQRLGLWKGDYSKDRVAELTRIHTEEGLDKPSKDEEIAYTWGTWNQEMQDYCVQDVEVTLRFLELIESKDVDPRAMELEHQVAFIVSEQVAHGFYFDEEGAERLLRKLQEERADVENKLQSLFDPWYSLDEVKVPKRTINYKDVTRHSTWQGAPYSKIKLNVFNAGSRAHIADRLMKKRGWKPSEFTQNGQPKIDDDILGNLPYPEAQQIAYYLMLQKRIGQLYEGRNSWLNLYNRETGRMHGSVVTNGAVTGRMTHNYPNVAQTPSVGKPYGKECRELWTVPAGKKLVGVDVSGLELRMLAHFMHPHDGGEYGHTVLNGDIHSVNAAALFDFDPDEFIAHRADHETLLMDVANDHKGAGAYLQGLSGGKRKEATVHDYYEHLRGIAKTFIYAFLYGAGTTLIGAFVGGGAKEGGQLKNSFLNKTPALNKLIKGVTAAAKKGWLKGLDGRVLSIRHQHAALNTLLQSAGALVCKRWAVEMELALREKGWKDRCQVVANIHDEHQYEVDEEIAEEVGQLSIECIKRAGEYFNIRMPLDGEANVGNNWKETH